MVNVLPVSGSAVHFCPALVGSHFDARTAPVQLLHQIASLLCYFYLNKQSPSWLRLRLLVSVQFLSPFVVVLMGAASPLVQRAQSVYPRLVAVILAMSRHHVTRSGPLSVPMEAAGLFQSSVPSIAFM